MPLPVIEQIVEIPFRLIVQMTRNVVARVAPMRKCLPPDSYRRTSYSAPLKASALPSRIARSYRATTAYQAPVWPDSLRR